MPLAIRATVHGWTEAIETYVLEVIFEQRRGWAADLMLWALRLLSCVFIGLVKVRQWVRPTGQLPSQRGRTINLPRIDYWKN